MTQNDLQRPFFLSKPGTPPQISHIEKTHRVRKPQQNPLKQESRRQLKPQPERPQQTLLRRKSKMTSLYLICLCQLVCCHVNRFVRTVRWIIAGITENLTRIQMKKSVSICDFWWIGVKYSALSNKIGKAPKRPQNPKKRPLVACFAFYFNVL